MQGHSSLDAVPSQLTLSQRVFGAPNTPDYVNKLFLSLKRLMSTIEKEFMNDAASTAAMHKGDVQHKITSLVSFSDKAESMKPWEQSANVRVVTEDLPGQPGAVEASFQSLIRDFGAHTAIPVLYGSDFLNRNPQLLDDFWKFDNELFPLLVVGIPEWMPFKMMKDGLAARDRVIDALEGLFHRIEQYQTGVPVDFGADMSDVGVALERNLICKEVGFSERERAHFDLSFLWGQNANTQPILFWFLTYIHSTPGLVDELRKEVAPYVKLSTSAPLEVASMNILALGRECPLFKSALFETYRLTNEPTSIRRVARPITVQDGDAKHQLETGTFVSAALSLIQKDPEVFPEPEKFIPSRFLEVDQATGKKVARYGRMRPWGIGSASCKGRTFAEKEIMTVAAAVISIWDITPTGTQWELPAMVPGTGAKKPVHDIRVLIRRREIH
jgi:hypothetical protein